MRREGFTLLELIVVVIIVGVLISIAVPTYLKTKESVFDKEVVTDLKALQIAQKSYKYDAGTYYPAAGSDSSLGSINLNLHLALQSTAWVYTVFSTGCSQATRNGSDGRRWFLTIANNEPALGLCP